MSTVLYCGIDDVTNRLSADGVTYRTDDSPPTEYGDVLDDASRVIDEHCLLGYSDANLAKSPWIKHRCADVATYLLCERRGNPVPPGIAQKYDRTMERLELVRLGKLTLPDIPQRRANVPVMSNVRIRLDPFPHSVVERNRSTSRNQPTDYAQNLDVLDWFNYAF